MSLISNIRGKLAALTGQERRAALEQHKAAIKRFIDQPRKLTAEEIEIERELAAADASFRAEMAKPLDIAIVFPSGRIVKPGEPRLSDAERAEAMIAKTPEPVVAKTEPEPAKKSEGIIQKIAQAMTPPRPPKPSFVPCPPVVVWRGRRTAVDPNAEFDDDPRFGAADIATKNRRKQQNRIGD
jgi:hypothetical protein